jgi:hypothetical protein
MLMRVACASNANSDRCTGNPTSNCVVNNIAINFPMRICFGRIIELRSSQAIIGEQSDRATGQVGVGVIIIHDRGWRNN